MLNIILYKNLKLLFLPILFSISFNNITFTAATPVDTLSEEVLAYIFDLLGPDVGRAAQVSKEWNRIAQAKHFDKVKQLKFKSDFDRLNEKNKVEYPHSLNKSELNVLNDAITNNKSIDFITFIIQNYPETITGSLITPLNKAIFANRQDIVELLLASGANPNIYDTAHNSTALFWATNFGNIQIVKMLLDNGADKNIRDYSDRTALNFARQLKEFYASRRPEKIEAYDAIIKLLKEK
jgi:ankyrin repeat protein